MLQQSIAATVWVTQSEQLILQDQATMTQFNQHQQELQGISKEQKKLQQHDLKKSNAAFDTLNNTFQKYGPENT